MPARTGEEYIAGLRERATEVYLGGEKVVDVTTHPALRNGVRTLASLLDMQHDPALRNEMTYISPTTGDRVGASFITPRSTEDLEHRRAMMSHWAQASLGMMGRTPDFLNVSLMAMAAAGEYFARDRPEFKENIQRYYEYVREHDLVLTHTLINLQRSRAPLTTALEDTTDVALSVVRGRTPALWSAAPVCSPPWDLSPKRSRFILPGLTDSPGLHPSVTPSPSPSPATPPA